jgi:hypothetical protein
MNVVGAYEPVSDVLYLSAPGDDKRAAAQETPEGHAVRLDGLGRVTHLTLINAMWLLDRERELVASLRDGRRLTLGRDDVAEILREHPAGRTSRHRNLNQ